MEHPHNSCTAHHPEIRQNPPPPLIAAAVAAANAGAAPVKNVLRFNPYVPSLPMYDQLCQHIGSITVIEGGIGAGKSTLGAILKEPFEQAGHNVFFIQESFDTELLHAMIEGVARAPVNAPVEAVFLFQMDMLSRRLAANRLAQSLARAGGIVFMDRCLVGDTVFARVNDAAGRFTLAQWNAYVARVREVDILIPNAIIYLECKVNTSQARIRRRHRQKEDLYSAEYLQNLTAMYERTFSEAESPYPLIRLPWSDERNVEDPHERSRIAIGVLKALENLRTQRAQEKFLRVIV